MPPLIIRYICLCLVIFGTSISMIACGAQYYQVPLHDDVSIDKDHYSGNIDDDAISAGIHSTDGWGRLPIPIEFGANLSGDQIDQIKRAMQTWTWASGRSQGLFSLSQTSTAVTGDSFPNLYDSLKDQLNGHYSHLIWSKTKKASFVLATTIWKPTSNNPRQIETADIRYNLQHYNMGDSFVIDSDFEKDVVDLESLALHEIGHLLGLSHISSEKDDLSIMNPSLFIGAGLSSRKVSKGDIERLQSIYGCHGQYCDMGRLHAALENNDVDWLSSF